MNVTPFKRPSRPEPGGHTPPMINLPPLTLWLLIVIVAIQIAMSFAPGDFMNRLGYNLAFIPARYTAVDSWSLWAVVDPVTHLFIHGGWLHVGMNGLMLMAFGTAAERMFGIKRTLILFVVAGVAGALAQFLVSPFSPVPMVGASGALSGLFAAVVLRMQKTGQMPAGRFGIWGVAALWIGLSLVTAGVGSAIGLGQVAWAAHAGGFIAGLALGRMRYFS